MYRHVRYIRLLAGILVLVTRVTFAAEPAAAGPSPSVTPGTLGRLHGTPYDPHARLDPEVQIRIALQHQVEGRPQEALNILSTAIANHPDQARLYAVRGSLLLAADRIALALADLEQAIELAPDNVEALTNRAQAYRRFGRIDQALADLTHALNLAPDFLAARFNRGALRYGAGDYQGALRDFDRCVALDPHLPAPYFNRASAQDALGNKNAAINDLERFLSLSRNQAWNRQARQMLQALKNPDSVPTAPRPEPLNQ